MFKMITAMLRDDEGATMIEYALIVGLIAAVAIATVTTLGAKIAAKFTSVQTGW